MDVHFNETARGVWDSQTPGGHHRGSARVVLNRQGEYEWRVMVGSHDAQGAEKSLKAAQRKAAAELTEARETDGGHQAAAPSVGQLADPTADGPVTDMQRRIIERRLTEEGLEYEPERLDGLTKGEAMDLVNILTTRSWKDGDAGSAVEDFYRKHSGSGGSDDKSMGLASALAKRLRGQRPRPAPRERQSAAGLRSAPGRVPGVKVISR